MRVDLRSDCSSRAIRLRILWPISLAAALLLDGSTDLCAQDPTFEDMAQALQDWKDSWVTLRVEWERRNPVQLRRYAKDPKILDAESLDDYFHREKWIFAGEGLDRYTWEWVEAGERVDLDFQVHNAGESLYFDGRYIQKMDGTDFLGNLHLNTWNPTAADRSDPKSIYDGIVSAVPVSPLYNFPQKEWLGETLAQGAGTLEDLEEIDGIKCARLRLGEYHVWLDPQHGFLPRRSAPAGGERILGGTIWTAEEFKRFENGIWFPVRGTFWWQKDETDEVTTWAVTDVAVNETLDPKLFKPPKPEIGTHVEDRITGRIYTHGRLPANREERERVLVEEARKNAPEPVDEPITAEIPVWDRYQWSVVLLATAGIVLGAGIWLSRRR